MVRVAGPIASTCSAWGDELTASLHCEIPGDVPLADAHIITEQAEQALRRRLPELGRGVIHVEPDQGEGANTDQRKSSQMPGPGPEERQGR